MLGLEDGSGVRGRRGPVGWFGLVVGLGAPAAGVQCGEQCQGTRDEQGERRRHQGPGVEWGQSRLRPGKSLALTRIRAVDLLHCGGGARQLRQDFRAEIRLLPVSQSFGQPRGKGPSPSESPGSSHSPLSIR